LLDYQNKTVILSPHILLGVMEKVLTQNNIEIEIIPVDENNFLEVARTQKANGKEIIISRGGMAKEIRKSIDITVVEITITGYDIFKALYQYNGKPKKIIVVENKDFTRGAEYVGRIMGLNLECYTVDNYEEIPGRIREAANNRADVIISGGWLASETTEIQELKERMIEFRTIESGEESILEAIDKAFNVYEATIAERQKKEEYKAVFDCAMEGIIIIDNAGLIKAVNPAAEKMFGLNSELSINKPLIDVVRSYNTVQVLKEGKASRGKLEIIKDMNIVNNAIPVIVNGDINGVVSTFQEATKLQEIEQKVRYKLADKGLATKYGFEDIIGQSACIQETIDKARFYSQTEATVLITGETGTGKELFAHSIHNNSRRRNNAFVAINCSALPGNLLESELFGYVEGSFTGARKSGKSGLFELAHNGTIFLDEIGDLDIELQTRLLRVIQEREIRKIGDDRIIPVNIRIIAATNKDLIKEVERGAFRADLFFRLNVLSLHIPPLRARKEDIPLLAGYISRKNNFAESVIDERIIKALSEYYWPGNIRELQNAVEKLNVIGMNRPLNDNDLKEVLESGYSMAGGGACVNDAFLHGSLEDIEMKVITQVLEEEGYNKTRTADRLKINRSTLNRKLQKSE